MGKFIPVDPDRWAELVKAAGERDALIVEVSHLTEENLLVREESDRHYGLFIKANAEVERWESENKLKAVRIEAQILDRLVELKAENARLKAEVERLRIAGSESEPRFVLLSDYRHLKAEVERLQSIHSIDSIGIEQLKAEVERLTKAGDAICKSFDEFGQVDATTLKGWKAAKSPTPLPNDNPTPRPL
jgi:hypothetical protein